MSLRPRYSLLTLLILTALVAGGVKLWYGPHHVVERIKSNEEREITFIRDWRGEQILQGPEVQRYFDADGNIYQIDLYYHRHGMAVSPLRYVFRRDAAKRLHNQYPRLIKNSPLTEAEQIEFMRIIDRERLRYEMHNLEGNLFEGYMNY